MRASHPHSPVRAASSSWRRTSAPLSGWTSPTTSSRRSTNTPPTAASTSGRPRAANDSYPSVAGEVEDDYERRVGDQQGAAGAAAGAAFTENESRQARGERQREELDGTE